jgi:predicted methyltransferase
MHASHRPHAPVAALGLFIVALAAAAPSPAADPEYERAVAAAGRSDKDRERDARDRPAQVLAFAGFRPGMRIADIFGAGGYYSEILAHLVGPKGKVLLVNDEGYAAYARDDLATRFKDGRLSEVERLVVPNEDLKLGSGTLDGMLMVMAYHDLYYSDPKQFPRIDAGQFLEQLRRALKPGGRLLIVDHAAAPAAGSGVAQTLHRIDEAFAVRDLESHGFRLEKKYDGLRNPADDHSKPVFDPAIRGHTDRFVHLYRRR